ncbi:hypothetical protein GQ457_04G032620 [Hibiscus cannabinus]
MSQCVPGWDLDDNQATARHSLRSNSNSTAPDVHTSEYEVAELTWENGQLAMHGLGPARVPAKPLISSVPSKYSTWDKPRGNGTLESIVNQATRVPYLKVSLHGGGDEIAPCLDQRRAPADALVPCSKRTSEDHRTTHVMESIPGLGGSRLVGMGCSTRVGSCSVPPAGTRDDDVLVTEKRRRATARVPVTPEWSGKEQSGSASATFGRESQYVTTFDTYEKDLGVGLTSTSLGSPENTSYTIPCSRATTGADDHDSVCHSRPQREETEEEEEELEKKETGKSSVSNKRSRAAAIHNQSERKRRDKINQRMKTLQKLVPNSSKTDKASMLDEVIDYLKQLQAQVHMMNRMNIPPMMLPMAMQPQLPMPMMAPAMGMGMGMGMNGDGHGHGRYGYEHHGPSQHLAFYA